MKKIAADEATEDIVQEILESISEKEGTTIPLLQKVQSRLGYVSPDAIRAIAEALELSESEVYGVATFYAEFKLSKPGRHQIKVCMGTSCYLRGGRALLEHMTRKLGIRPRQTTEDGEFSLETVACLGCCSKSPVMAVDDVIYGGISPSLADNILSCLESES
jgi:NADH:ubiquinone oxidoreductase subunit E